MSDSISKARFVFIPSTFDGEVQQLYLEFEKGELANIYELKQRALGWLDGIDLRFGKNRVWRDVVFPNVYVYIQPWGRLEVEVLECYP